MANPSLTPFRLRASSRAVLRRAAYELQTHWRRVRAPWGQRSAVFFPSNQPWDPASNLRAWLVAPALRDHGWRVVVVPEALDLSQRRRILSLERPDVVFIQQTRHPSINPGSTRRDRRSWTPTTPTSWIPDFTIGSVGPPETLPRSPWGALNWPSSSPRTIRRPLSSGHVRHGH